MAPGWGPGFVASRFREVAIRAQAMGMRVVAYEPYPDRDFVRERSIDLVELEELFEKSDYITLHVPMNSETAGMINRESLARMKTGSVLINTARGGLIKEKDLLEALKEGPLAAAALDVLETEPAYLFQILKAIDQKLLLL